jgi:hypothetical protein
MQQRIATLEIVQTSPQCLSYRLLAGGRVVWSNRVYNRPEGDAGARRRMAAWAWRNVYRVVEWKGGEARQRRYG